MNKSVDAAHAQSDSPLDPNECTRANRIFFKRLRVALLNYPEDLTVLHQHSRHHFHLKSMRLSGQKNLCRNTITTWRP